jgi:hypothetical protein
MANLALANYIRFKTKAGAYTSYAFANFHIQETRTYNNVDYTFVPFALSGMTSSRGGDRPESALVTPCTQLSMQLLTEAVESKWLLEIKTVLLDSDTFQETALISTEMWSVTRLDHDLQKINVRLTSPLDAVKGTVPRRYLHTRLVGAVPGTGNITVS